MADTRLIEVAFPLKQTSLDSVYEKKVRHGHISTLHIWPARRPLAASRAALIATLLKDPEDANVRRQMLDKLGGKLNKDGTKTEGGILHWGRESGPDLQWFRDRIRETYGGRAPRMLDPFAGGGAIPLEAMRLGCEVTAADINPVAWFILKCTLEYPQRMAGKDLPLPAFALQSVDFMTEYLLAKGVKKASLQATLSQLGVQPPSHMLLVDGEKKNVTAVQLLGKLADDKLQQADLAWHVRAWGGWVLQQARKDLEHLYPVVENKPTVAYLWARTITCKNCRATVPLLKTRWLCKKDNKRVVLTMQPNADRTGVIFGVLANVEIGTGSTAQKREHDKKLGKGTMSRSGVECPCCKTIMRMEEIRAEGQAGRLGTLMTSVVINGKGGKGYRLPAVDEIEAAQQATQEIDEVFAKIPFGLPEEKVPKGGNGASRAFSVDGYGFDKWYKLFTARQLVALGTFVKHTRAVREAMKDEGYDQEWIEIVNAYLALSINRLVAFSSANVRWKLDAEAVVDAFARFALPVLWDYAEGNTIGESAGSYKLCYERICSALDTYVTWRVDAPAPIVINGSAIKSTKENIDVIVTDPPYYDAIPYADLMDFFYVWFHRTLYGLSKDLDQVFHNPLSPKWDHDENDGELIDDSSRFQGNKQTSKQNYEDGMARAFQACYRALAPDGRLVIVFAHKQPDAWETLVSSIIRAGFVVDGSWPIQTEMESRTRALSSAALSSSVWLVCKKRARTVQPGWDQSVLAEMREKIHDQLRNFWDAGIRGPDFVWAATGPAMEAYSKYPVVMKADQSGNKRLEVRDFLQQVRRMVLDFVVGRVLTRDGDETAARGLDEITTYYLLHRHDFQMESVPVGPCILYAVSCGLKDVDLTDRYDILARSGGQETAEDEDEEGAEGDEESGGSRESEEGTKSKVRLKAWSQRKRPEMGYTAPPGRSIPIIDQIHRMLHLWAAKDQAKVDTYVEDHGLGQHPLFAQVLQALIELAPEGSEERALLESISNHVGGHSSKEKRLQVQQPNLFV